MRERSDSTSALWRPAEHCVVEQLRQQSGPGSTEAAMHKFEGMVGGFSEDCKSGNELEVSKGETTSLLPFFLH